MKIVLGADHAGYPLKEELKQYLQDKEYTVIDKGTNSGDSVDYPDFAYAVGKVIMENQADRGILICGSGVGANVVVNKLPGIRASVCHDVYSAGQGVEHDDMNVLVLGGRVIGPEVARTLVDAFLGAVFSGEERHVRRLDKVKAIEQKFLKAGES